MASHLSEPGRLLSRLPAGDTPGETALPHLQTRVLEKAFGPRVILRGLEVQVAHGEFVAVIGRSGCGKSTLLRLLAGLERPSAGDILLDGTPLSGLNRAARVMFQEPRLLPWERVARNVGLGLGPGWLPQAEAALREVGLEDRAGDWPAVLSGGQRQRVALARALAAQPEMLLLDEPLGALDALTRLEMQRLIERVWQRHGCTVLLITHDVEEALALADRVLLMEGGRIVLDTPVSLSRPRPRAAPEFVDFKEGLLGRLLERA